MRRPGVVEWGTGGVKKRETGWGGRLCKTRTSVAPCGAAQMGSNGNLSSSCVPSASVARPLSGFASRRRSGVTPDHRAAACRAPERACGGGGGEGRPRVQAACAHSRKCCICSRICALRANPRERCQPRLVELLLLTDCFMPHRPLCLPSWNGMNSITVERGQVEFK